MVNQFCQVLNFFCQANLRSCLQRTSFLHFIYRIGVVIATMSHLPPRLQSPKLHCISTFSRTIYKKLNKKKNRSYSEENRRWILSPCSRRWTLCRFNHRTMIEAAKGRAIPCGNHNDDTCTIKAATINSLFVLDWFMSCVVARKKSSAFMTTLVQYSL